MNTYTKTDKIAAIKTINAIAEKCGCKIITTKNNRFKIEGVLVESEFPYSHESRALLPIFFEMKNRINNVYTSDEIKRIFGVKSYYIENNVNHSHKSFFWNVLMNITVDDFKELYDEKFSNRRMPWIYLIQKDIYIQLNTMYELSESTGTSFKKIKRVVKCS